MTNFEAIMKHFKVTYPLLNSELLTTYFSALVAQGVLPTPKKKIRGLFFDFLQYINIFLKMYLCLRYLQSHLAFTLSYSHILLYNVVLFSPFFPIVV